MFCILNHNQNYKVMAIKESISNNTAVVPFLLLAILGAIVAYSMYKGSLRKYD